MTTRNGLKKSMHRYQLAEQRETQVDAARFVLTCTSADPVPVVRVGGAVGQVQVDDRPDGRRDVVVTLPDWFRGRDSAELHDLPRTLGFRDLHVLERQNVRCRGWVARRCEGRGVGEKPERDEQVVHLAGVGHERDDAAATTARANQNVLSEHPAQQVSPWQPAGTRQDGLRSTGAVSVGRADVGGGHQRAELRACLAGRAEDPGVAHQVALGGGMMPTSLRKERDWFEHPGLGRGASGGRCDHRLHARSWTGSGVATERRLTSVRHSEIAIAARNCGDRAHIDGRRRDRAGYRVVTLMRSLRRAVFSYAVINIAIGR
jgi:hypothetical protein